MSSMWGKSRMGDPGHRRGTGDRCNETATQSGRAAHLAFGATAILAWLGMALNLTLTALGTQPSPQTAPTLLGFNGPGIVWTQPSEEGLPPSVKRGTRARPSTATREGSHRDT